jgi:UDP-N-acetylglucosamine--N-acetylmuramyl-(pentapeptide) pyrophosphoryl-undecaprenol N-acetylglucosamine transferase
MGILYSASTLVIARSGAGTLAELAALGCPSILVPLPTAADNHQYLNAKAFSETGCAVVLEESRLPESLSTVLTMLQDLEALERMKLALSRWSKRQGIENLLRSMLSEERSVAV